MGTSMGVSVRTVIIVVVSLRVVISICERYIWSSPTVSMSVVLLIIVRIIVTVISKTPIANLIVVIVVVIVLRLVVVVEPLRVTVQTPVTNVGV